MKKLIIVLLAFGFFLLPRNTYAQQGCCSWHGGVAGCSANGRKICNDGTLSPTCTCAAVQTTVTYTPAPTPRPTIQSTPKPTSTPVVLGVSTTSSPTPTNTPASSPEVKVESSPTATPMPTSEASKWGTGIGLVTGATALGGSYLGLKWLGKRTG